MFDRPCRRCRNAQARDLLARLFTSFALVALAMTTAARAETPAAAAPAETRPLPFAEGSETLVVLTDTEGYAGRRPQIFNAMLQWVADERERRAIRYLLHVGDVTNSNTPGEWANARAAFDLIEGKVPYVLAAGNHDNDGQPDDQERTHARRRLRAHFRLPPGA